MVLRDNVMIDCMWLCSQLHTALSLSFILVLWTWGSVASLTRFHSQFHTALLDVGHSQHPDLTTKTLGFCGQNTRSEIHFSLVYGTFILLSPI